MYFGGGNNVTVSDNTFINGTLWGLYVANSYNCTITRNLCSLCGDGILLDSSRGNIINDCVLNSNTNGLSLESSYMNTVKFCELNDNEVLGIHVDSSSPANRFNWNVFLSNSVGDVYCDGIANVFDYNYFADYMGPDVDQDGVCDYPYPIAGSAWTADLHPLLMEPVFPIWDPSPVNQRLEFGEEYSYSLEVSSPVPMRDWRISDTVNFMIDESGTIQDIGILDVGTYPIRIVATNSFGLSLEGSFIVTVEDSVSPIWISQIQDKVYRYGETAEIQLMAWDLAGIVNWSVSNSENFSLSATSFAQVGILTIIKTWRLAVGIHPLTVTAYDPSGNSVTATFTVTVTESGAGDVGMVGPELRLSAAGFVLGVMALGIGIAAHLNSRKGS